MAVSTPRQLLSEAVRLLRESSRHFKSRQVAEARRLIEQALTQLGETDAQKANRDTDTDDDAETPSRPQKTDQHHD